MTSIDAIINRQLLRWELERKRALEQPHESKPPTPIVTISRQTGSRGSYFGSRLAQRLGYQRLHREVIEAVTQSSGYYKRIVESLDEHFRGSLDLMVEGMITGQSVDHADYVRHLGRVVLSMSELGGIVLMGRGGNFILGPNRGFHLRFVCPVEIRIENLMKFCGSSHKEAQKTIEISDTERRAFVAKVFHADIDEPAHYDMVINSAYMDVEDLLEVVVLAMKAKLDRLTFRPTDQTGSD